MSHRVVCISFVTGAGSETIGRLVAARLGFRYVDDEIVTLAAEASGVDRSILESAEHHHDLLASLVDAVLSRGVETPESVASSESGNGPSGGSPPAAPGGELRRLIEAAILEIARRGNAVIVAHGASFALRGRSDVLRVHVVASQTTRMRRLAGGAALVSEQEYVEMIAESDRQRAKYLARFYGIDEELPSLYDLVIDTDTLDLEQAAAVIVAAATK
jgi:cytidylate kinase